MHGTVDLCTQLFVHSTVDARDLVVCIVVSSGNWHVVGSRFIQNVCHLLNHSRVPKPL